MCFAEWDPTCRRVNAQPSPKPAISISSSQVDSEDAASAPAAFSPATVLGPGCLARQVPADVGSASRAEPAPRYRHHPHVGDRAVNGHPPRQATGAERMGPRLRDGPPPTPPPGRVRLLLPRPSPSNGVPWVTTDWGCRGFGCSDRLSPRPFRLMPVA